MTYWKPNRLREVSDVLELGLVDLIDFTQDGYIDDESMADEATRQSKEIKEPRLYDAPVERGIKFEPRLIGPTVVSMANDLCIKTREVAKGEKPYEVWVDEEMGCEYQVLRKCNADDNMPFARWFVRLKSPFTFGSWEYYEQYVADIKRGSRLVEVNYDA